MSRVESKTDHTIDHVTQVTSTGGLEEELEWYKTKNLQKNSRRVGRLPPARRHLTVRLRGSDPPSGLSGWSGCRRRHQRERTTPGRILYLIVGVDQFCGDVFAAITANASPDVYAVSGKAQKKSSFPDDLTDETEIIDNELYGATSNIWASNHNQKITDALHLITVTLVPACLLGTCLCKSNIHLFHLSINHNLKMLMWQ